MWYLSLDEENLFLKERVKYKNQVEANLNGISIIVQEMGTLSGLTVAENIFWDMRLDLLNTELKIPLP